MAFRLYPCATVHVQVNNRLTSPLLYSSPAEALGHRQKILRAVLVVKEQGFYVSGKPSGECCVNQFSIKLSCFGIDNVIILHN